MTSVDIVDMYFVNLNVLCKYSLLVSLCLSQINELHVFHGDKTSKLVPEGLPAYEGWPTDRACSLELMWAPRAALLLCELNVFVYSVAFTSHI